MIFSNKIIGKNINLIILKIFLWLFHSFNLINEILILLILKKLFVFLQIESFFENQERSRIHETRMIIYSFFQCCVRFFENPVATSSKKERLNK